MREFFTGVHPEWHELLTQALRQVDAEYLESLTKNPDNWLPGLPALFSAFSLPLSGTDYILLGESPYPRVQSANGYAFWDNAVNEIWSDSGLSKPVNRATSLRNLIKMLLHARGDLISDFSQPAIAGLNHRDYIQSLPELFNRLIEKGFLLLNASLVYRQNEVNYHARQWQPFMNYVLTELAQSHSQIQLILFGRIAEKVQIQAQFSTLTSEHPYNVSFITNPFVLEFFKPLDLLAKYE